MKRTKKNNEQKGHPENTKYPEELHSFAMTLSYYSSKGYEFIREQFSDALPSQRTIRNWYSRVPAEPGFTEPAFTALKAAVEDAKMNNKEVLLILELE